MIKVSIYLSDDTSVVAKVIDTVLKNFDEEIKLTEINLTDDVVEEFNNLIEESELVKENLEEDKK